VGVSAADRPSAAPAAKQRIALTVAYDGSGFAGWQTQPDGNTIQDRLEYALACIVGEPVPTICAGRTDAGVHALRQVVHFDVCRNRPLSAWLRGVNRYLPPGIAVRGAWAVDEEFHARFGALRRAYRYQLLSAAVSHPLLAGRVGWTHRPLDSERLRQASTLLMGEHDFSAFRSSQCQAHSPVRRMDSIAVETMDARSTAGRLMGLQRSDDCLISIRFVGNAFLHHMIRNIVGALVMVGSGQRPVQWVGHLLASRDRRLGAPTFAAAGLCFEGVEYDPRYGLDSWPTCVSEGQLI
jgi:tRNA pseudouridine38-40 synthase